MSAPAEDKHALELLKAIEAGRRDLGRNKRFVAVLFADLCNSTSYKIVRGDVEGLIKTHAHNTIVGDAVNRNRGKIIKYIGDEVMATFSDDTAIADAVGAATEIQHDIAVYNDNNDNSKDEQIESKIGIHAGEVIMVKFPGNDAEDPQGKVVDATARIISFSNPGQVLCSGVIKNRLAHLKFSEPHFREAKGIKDGLELFEVIYDGKKPQAPKLLRHQDNSETKVQRLLYNAVREELTDSEQAANSHYEQILSSDPLHFAANYRKARLEWRNKERRNGDLSDIIALATIAERSHPDSGLAKGFTVLVEYEQERLKSGGGEPQLDPGLIVEWIEKLRLAVQCARSECDLYGELDSLNTLSWLLASQYDDTRSMETFREALMICNMVENHIKYLEDNLQAAFYDTYARVLSFDVTSRESYDKARRLAKRSMDLKPSESVLETLKRLHRLGTNNGWPLK